MKPSMKHKKSLTVLASAVSLALAGMMLTSTVSAGVVDNRNNVTSPSVVLGACGTLVGVDSTAACVGAWNLGNVEVQVYNLTTLALLFPSFDETLGTYPAMTYGDSFVSLISDGDNPATIMGKLSGKVWPIGEPTGIKAVNADLLVKTDGTPSNCLINTGYLGAANSSTGLDAYLDSTNPEPVICSSDFQSHKRFKVAMQPATTDIVPNGADGKAIDLVFNATDNATINPYQVFSKINNYTNKRLKGYKIVVGRGLGASFQSASALNIANQLQISIGVGEEIKPSTTTTDLFAADQLATFSHGLFGPAEPPNFPTVGFFDAYTAGFNVAQNSIFGCTAIAPATICSDTIYSTTPLVAPTSPTRPTNYTTLFGDWLPSIWAPKGIFFDDDNNPTTDAVLVAWWNGTAWLKGYVDNFTPVTTTEFNTWAASPLYAIDTIEDVLNLGPNYIVKVGDINALADAAGGNGSTFTVRIIPILADTQVAPAWVGTTPTPLVVPTTTTTVSSGGGGGGCTIGNDSRFDPTLPALLAAGLGLLGWRRFKTRK